MYNLRRLLQFVAQQSHLSFSTTFVNRNAVAELLENRGILRISGEESSGFLQGLITNDMSHLGIGSSSMYTMFLNSKGRVMYDAIIYKTSEPYTLFVECDSSALPGVERHLRMYRLRKRISVDSVADLKVWAVYHCLGEAFTHDAVEDIKSKVNGGILMSEREDGKAINGSDKFGPGILISSENLLLSHDPRIAELGIRVVCPSSEDIPRLLQVDRGSSYRKIRYHLGVGEGVNDLPPDNCFPLEANCDYLHGVSFHKGCYIGQELTARTHHTGVVRKRLMPIFLEQQVNISNASRQEILNNKQKAVGKVRGLEGTTGLGLMRVSEALSADSLSLGSTKVLTKRPSWWPKEAPKELESRSRQ